MTAHLKANAEKIVIMGCGEDAERLYYNLRKSGQRVDFFLSNHRRGKFHDADIYSPEKKAEELKNALVLIASNEKYQKYREQLESYGLREFESFIQGGAFNKQLVFINANCYGHMLYTVLDSSEAFREKYFIYDSTPLYDVQELKRREQLARSCDVCLCQDITEDNIYGAAFSEKNVRSSVGEDCRFIVIPNLVKLGRICFPQAEGNDDRNRDDISKNMRWGMFPYRDVIIDQMVSEGEKPESIVKRIQSGKCFSRQSIMANYEKTVKQYRLREEHWDVKIMDEVIRSLRVEKTFYDTNHPNERVFSIIAKGILKELGVDDTSVHAEHRLNDFEMPVYPEVAECLGLSWWKGDEILRKGSFYNFSDRMDLREYVRQYIWWCYDRNGRTGALDI